MTTVLLVVLIIGLLLFFGIKYIPKVIEAIRAYLERD